MDKQINKIHLVLKIIFYNLWFISILLYILGKSGCLADFAVEPHSTTEYVVEYICIGAVVLGIPLALKLFTLNTNNNLKRMNFDEALACYFQWSIFRLAILEIVSCFGVLAYFITLRTSCVLCTLMTLVVTVLCYPSKQKIRDFLDNLNNGVE